MIDPVKSAKLEGISTRCQVSRKQSKHPIRDRSWKSHAEQYRQAIDKIVLYSLIANGRRKGNKFTYNAKPGYVNLYTGQFVQNGKPKWKTIKI